MRGTKAPPHRLTPFLLIFVLLCLTAPGWAFHIALDSPIFDYAPNWQIQYMHWHVATDGPQDICLGLKKVEYWVDDARIDEYNWASANPSITSHEWTYDGSRRRSGGEHSYTVKVWIYASEFGGMPPMPRTVEKELTPYVLHSRLYTEYPLRDFSFEDDGDSSAVSFAGSLARDGLALMIGGQTIQPDSSLQFSASVPVAEGATSIEVHVSDPEEGELVGTALSVYRAHVTAQLSQNTADFGANGSVTVTATPSADALVQCLVFDSKGVQIAKVLGVYEAVASQQCSFTWDGSAEQSFRSVASNGKVVPGTYRLRVATFAPPDADGEQAGCTAQTFDLSVSNTGGSPPDWTTVEAEKDETGLTLSGQWSGRIWPWCSNGGCISIEGQYAAQELSLAFNGTGVDVAYPALVGGDSFEAEVDGQANGTFGPSSSGEVEYGLFTIAGLAPGPHTLTVRPLPNAKGWFRGAIDALLVR